jgi:type I restriction enzyme S subunit
MTGSKGTKMPRGDKNQILQFEIPQFELEYQQKIACVLSTFDAKIELNNKINAELEAMAKTLYDYWFVQFDFPDKNGKPYKSSGGKMVWNEELKREIPEGWEVKGLFNVCNVQYGFPFSTAYFNTNELGKPVIRIRDILENSVSNYSSERDIDDKYLINQGDILIGMDGNFHINYWSKKGCYLNQRVVKLSKTILPNIYLKYQVEPHIILREKSVSRTTVGHLSDKDLKAIKVILPSKEIIDQIGQTYSNFLKKIIINKNENQQLATLRDWLLPMLMNGQVKMGEVSKVYDMPQVQVSMVAEE